MNNVLVLGGSGLVGSKIVDELCRQKKYTVHGTCVKRAIQNQHCISHKLRLEDLIELDQLLASINPKIVVSCITGDFKLQLQFHQRVAEYLKEQGGQLYYISTTNVFDKQYGTRAYYEDDPVAAATDYGNFKIQCEKLISGILGDRAIILRIPAVWGKTCPRISQLKQCVLDGKEIVVYPKLYMSNVTDVIIAKKLYYIIENNLKGIFHLASTDTMSFAEFRYHLIDALGLTGAIFKEDNTEEGYFAILSKYSSQMPKELSFTIQDILDYLTA